MRGHFEICPYDDSTKRSVYHIRNLEIFRLKQLTNPIDIFLSHDWPTNVTDYGNKEQLIRFKPHFKWVSNFMNIIVQYNHYPISYVLGMILIQKNWVANLVRIFCTRSNQNIGFPHIYIANLLLWYRIKTKVVQNSWPSINVCQKDGFFKYSMCRTMKTKKSNWSTI